MHEIARHRFDVEAHSGRSRYAFAELELVEEARLARRVQAEHHDSGHWSLGPEVAGQLAPVILVRGDVAHFVIQLLAGSSPFYPFMTNDVV